MEEKNLINAKNTLKELITALQDDAKKAFEDKQDNSKIAKIVFDEYISHKKNEKNKESLTTWIVIGISIITIIVSLSGAWFGSKLKLQSSFNDVLHLKEKIMIVEKKIETHDCFKTQDILYRYKIDKLLKILKNLNWRTNNGM